MRANTFPYQSRLPTPWTAILNTCAPKTPQSLSRRFKKLWSVAVKLSVPMSVASTCHRTTKGYPQRGRSLSNNGASKCLWLALTQATTICILSENTLCFTSGKKPKSFLGKRMAASCSSTPPITSSWTWWTMSLRAPATTSGSRPTVQLRPNPGCPLSSWQRGQAWPQRFSPVSMLVFQTQKQLRFIPSRVRRLSARLRRPRHGNLREISTFYLFWKPSRPWSRSIPTSALTSSKTLSHYPAFRCNTSCVALWAGETPQSSILKALKPLTCWKAPLSAVSAWCLPTSMK